MRYKPERALTHSTCLYPTTTRFSVEMRYKPERALTRYTHMYQYIGTFVEMRYKPERALTQSNPYSKKDK